MVQELARHPPARDRESGPLRYRSILSETLHQIPGGKMVTFHGKWPERRTLSPVETAWEPGELWIVTYTTTPGKEEKVFERKVRPEDVFQIPYMEFRPNREKIASILSYLCSTALAFHLNRERDTVDVGGPQLRVLDGCKDEEREPPPQIAAEVPRENLETPLPFPHLSDFLGCYPKSMVQSEEAFLEAVAHYIAECQEKGVPYPREVLLEKITARRPGEPGGSAARWFFEAGRRWSKS